MNREGTVACISVVIPVYNEEATLAAVVHKLIDVVPGLLEIIIVNDCSADDTRLALFPCRVIVAYSQPHLVRAMP